MIWSKLSRVIPSPSSSPLHLLFIILIFSIISTINSKTLKPPPTILTINGPVVPHQPSFHKLVRSLDLSSSPSQSQGSSSSRRLEYGQTQSQSQSQNTKSGSGSSVPDPITISSQAIVINPDPSGSSNSQKSRKGARNLEMFDQVRRARVIEGVRVPDDETDKYLTWRNARVIKGMLFPNARSTPKKATKRQIVLQDAKQYLANHGLLPQGTTLIDATGQGGMTSLQNVFQDINGNLYSGAPQNGYAGGGGPPIQIQTATAVPLSSHGSGGSSNSQMYLIQPGPEGDGSTGSGPSSYGPYLTSGQFLARNGEGFEIANLGASDLTPDPAQITPTKLPQPPQVTVISHASPPQHQTQPPPTPRKSQGQGQDGSSKPKPNPNKGPSESMVQSESQNIQAVTAVPVDSQVQQAILIPQGAPPGSTLVQGHLAASPTPDPSSYAAHVLQVSPYPHYQQATATMFASPTGQTYILHQGPPPQLPPDAFEERLSSPSSGVAYQASPSSFVIKPQTYIAGPGGQAFTVPIPIPADQVLQDQAQGQDDDEEPDHHHPRQHPRRDDPEMRERDEEDERPPQGQGHRDRGDREKEGRERERERPPQAPRERERDRDRDRIRDHRLHRDRDDKPPKSSSRPTDSFLHRILDSFTLNKRTMERVETNIALPVLASTGVFFGLGALAAGWYLSSQNREVGVLRRTGMPGSTGNAIKRIRRHAHPFQIPMALPFQGQGQHFAHQLAPKHPAIQEVDQASFFQSIIQQAIEKQTKEYEEVIEPSAGDEVKSKVKSPSTSASSRHDEVYENESDLSPSDGPSDKGSHSHPKRPPVKKSWLRSRQALNFARVAIPAFVIGGATLLIGALIFGWYISGSNREIAFLEPSAISRRRRRRRKRELELLDDGTWLARVMTSVHHQQDQSPPLSPTNPRSSGGISGKEIELDLSTETGVVFSFVTIVFFSLMALLLAFYISEKGKGSLGWLSSGDNKEYQYVPLVTPQGHDRVRRAVEDLTSNHLLMSSLEESSNPRFLDHIFRNLEVTQSKVLSRLQDVGYTKWQETPCAKRIFCDVMVTQTDETRRAMEKRMATFISMLPNSLSTSLSKSLGEVMMAIQRRDCSPFSCGGHWVDSSITETFTSTSSSTTAAPSSSLDQPR